MVTRSATPFASDFVVNRTIHEVKNVRYQHMSRQLKDSVAIARSRGGTVVLWVNGKTRVSSAIRNNPTSEWSGRGCDTAEEDGGREAGLLRRAGAARARRPAGGGCRGLGPGELSRSTAGCRPSSSRPASCARRGAVPGCGCSGGTRDGGA
ncbi:hypothetical protein J4038_13715 [Cellulomonas sp. zg-ZUI40]|nr:hypothetical protein [Cellulomonas dongxiuzhuiae]